VLIEKAAGKKITYVPFKGGGDVAVQLVGKHVDSTVNNPIEAESHWRAGKLRPLCVMDKRKPMPYKTKVTATQSWADIPTCKSAGIDGEYLMLRGIFMPPGVDARPGELLRRPVQEGARQLPEWKEFMEKGAFNQTFMTGKEYADWVAKAEADARRADEASAGFLAK
jgi:putative tricarboxylic transport membrane protein